MARGDFVAQSVTETNMEESRIFDEERQFCWIFEHLSPEVQEATGFSNDINISFIVKASLGRN